VILYRERSMLGEALLTSPFPNMTPSSLLSSPYTSLYFTSVPLRAPALSLLLFRPTPSLPFFGTGS
jgi:hypothetical protein